MKVKTYVPDEIRIHPDWFGDLEDFRIIEALRPAMAQVVSDYLKGSLENEDTTVFLSSDGSICVFLHAMEGATADAPYYKFTLDDLVDDFLEDYEGEADEAASLVATLRRLADLIEARK